MQITPGNLHAPCMQPVHVTPTRDSCIWPHPVIPARRLCAAQLNLRSWVDWAPLQNLAKNATFLERQRSVISARDVSRDFFRSRWVSPFNQPNVFVAKLTVLHRYLKSRLAMQRCPTQRFKLWRLSCLTTKAIIGLVPQARYISFLINHWYDVKSI